MKLHLTEWELLQLLTNEVLTYIKQDKIKS